MLSVFLIPPGGLTSEAGNSICQNKCKIQRDFIKLWSLSLIQQSSGNELHRDDQTPNLRD